MRSRLERANDKRDDEAYYLYKWRFAMKPSEIRARERKIARLDGKIERLRCAGGAS